MLPSSPLRVFAALLLASLAAAQYGVYPSSTFTFSGCYTVTEPSCNETSAALDSRTHVSAGFTISACASLCSSFPVFALQNGTTCTCAAALDDLSSAALVSVAADECGSACTRAAAPCGAADKLQVYTHTNFTPPIPYTSGAVFPYLGCVPAGNISSAAAQRIVSPDMTRERCVDYCLGSGMYYYFATQDGDTCYCASTLPATAGLAANDSASLCDSPCSGNASESCGGPTHLSLYGKPQSLAVVGAEPYYYQGCFPDPTNTTVGMLANKTVTAADMDVDKCQAACEGFPNFGLEAGTQCHCTTNEAWRGTAVDNGLCSASCAGAPALACGGYGYVSMYTNPALRRANPTMVDGYNMLSCWTNSGDVPSLDGSSASHENMTLDMCRDWCGGYEYFAIGNGSTCYCGNSLKGGAAADLNCNLNCGGDGRQWCGGLAHINVYKKANLPA